MCVGSWAVKLTAKRVGIPSCVFSLRVISCSPFNKSIKALQLVHGLAEIQGQGIPHIDFSERNILVADDKESGRSTVEFFDFGFSRPNQFDTSEEMKRHDVEKATFYDVMNLYYFLSDMCGGAWGRPEYLDAHRRRFLEWVLQEYPNDPVVSTMWKRYITRYCSPRDLDVVRM